MSPRRNKPGVSLGTVLQIAFLVVLLGAAVFLIGTIVGAQPRGQGRLLSYGDFEAGVRKKAFSEAVVDGNVVVLRYRDREDERVRVEVPEPSMAVALMLKYGVDVKARRPVPASGLTTPVLLALLIPYAVLAYFGFGLVRAVAGSAEFDGLEQEKEPAGRLASAGESEPDVVPTTS